MDISAEKNKLRQTMRMKRMAINQFDVKQWSQIITMYLKQEIDWEHISAIHTYVALMERHEVLTQPIMNYAFQNQPDVRIFVPEQNWDTDEQAIAEIDGSTQFTRDAKGFLIPKEAKSVRENRTLDTILVPCLAADKHGNRLGSGRGFYDKFLQKHPNATTIGLCFSENIVDEVPMEEHDVQLDVIVTEAEVLRN